MSKKKKVSKIKLSTIVILMLLPSGSVPENPGNTGLQPLSAVCLKLPSK